MDCREFKEIADSYLNDELLVETNHEVLRHLETCAACRSDFSDRRELRRRVRSAVVNSPEMQLDPAFRVRLERNLRNSVERPNFWAKLKNAGFVNFKFAALASILLVIFSLFGAYLLRRANSHENLQTVNNQVNPPLDAPPSTPIPQVVTAAWRESVKKAVGDHQNCAVKFNLAEKPISLDKAAAKYGKFYKNIDKAVMTALDQMRVPNPSEKTKKTEKIELIDAHSCVFQGIRFAHIVLRFHREIVSVLVSEPDGTAANDDLIINQNEGAIRASSFHAANHTVFVVSELPEADNLEIARQIQTPIKQHIEQNAV